MIQSSPCIELHFSPGVTYNFKTLSALFHERNQITMKLHVEICHVSPILPRSNLLDVRHRDRLIVSVLSPIQDRSRLMEALRSLDTKLVPPTRPSFLITLETLSSWKLFCLKVTGIVRRLGNLRSAKIGESFHLSLRLLSLHFQTLLEHLLLVHQLLECRHTKTIHASPLPIQSRPQRKTTRQQPGSQELNTAAPLPC